MYILKIKLKEKECSRFMPRGGRRLWEVESPPLFSYIARKHFLEK
jgi:hypothetical protein